jgi:hypothetical protein
MMITRGIRLVSLRASSVSPVNFPPVAVVTEIDTPENCVEFVKRSVIADAKFEFRTALEALVRESLQTRAHCHVETKKANSFPFAFRVLRSEFAQ